MIRMQVIGKVVVVVICLLSYGCTNNDIVGDPLTYGSMSIIFGLVQ